MKLRDYDVVKRPLLTEKLDLDRENNNAYAFEVDRRATKIEVRRAVERLFQVSVLGVRTQVVRGKPKRIGRSIGHRSTWKKAIVKLKKGDEIDFVEGGASVMDE